MRRIQAAEARALLHGAIETAFIDVREAGEFGEGHPLFAVSLPYSRLEARVGMLVPRRDVAVVLVDGGDAVAELAAARLEALRYTDVAIVEGGAHGWEKAGYTLYKGVNVPSKTLGELAEALWHPATVDAAVLADWQARGRPFALFDARPPEEYAKMRVPGARCLPNGELAHRLGAVTGDDPLVITCAGRTRGIVGAIGLRLAGREAPVLALENGTQGWVLAGHQLERGNHADPYPAIDAGALARSRERAAAILDRYGIARTSAAEVAAMLAEAGRTTYVFDVRSHPEAAGDPVPTAAHAPSGQLVQATDQWVGVRRARIVLCDEGGLRSAIAAFWLKQLGYEPVVAEIDDALRALPAREAPGPEPATRRIDAPAAMADAEAGALLLDLRGSMEYRREHVAGAIWAIRPRLAKLGSLRGRTVAVIAQDCAVADLAAVDLKALGAGGVDWIDGAHAALVAAGARTEQSPARPTDAEAIDHLFFVHDRHDGNHDASRRYLQWETGLVGQLDAEERAEFRLIAPPRD